MKSTVDPIISLKNACLTLGRREIWHSLDLEVNRGEFIAILGPNGSGKTALLRVLLGLESLSRGSATVAGEAPRRGNRDIGYIPQQKAFDRDLPIRGRDLVRFGLDGHKYGVGGGEPKSVRKAIKMIGAEDFASKPIGRLSGGEQQRLRVAQALIGNPEILLCDEPLLSLDISQQQVVSSLIDEERRQRNATVLFVTHDINPILPFVDRVVYLVNGKWAVGEPKRVLTNETLSELYNAQVEVVQVKGRIIVVGAEDTLEAELTEHHHHHNGRRHD